MLLTRKPLKKSSTGCGRVLAAAAPGPVTRSCRDGASLSCRSELSPRSHSSVQGGSSSQIPRCEKSGVALRAWCARPCCRRWVQLPGLQRSADRICSGTQGLGARGQEDGAMRCTGPRDRKDVILHCKGSS